MTRLSTVLSTALILSACALAFADDETSLREVSLSGGDDIATLRLFDETRNRVRDFDQPGESIPLPPGRYRVEHIELGGAFSNHGYARPPKATDWLTVSANGPNEWTIGGPLSPCADVKRYGPSLQLEFKTIGPAGRAFINKSADDRTSPPSIRFLVDGQVVHSDTFEYG